MEHLKYIKGMDRLIQELPTQYRYLPLFGNILKLEYLKEFDYEKWTDIYNVRLLVADEAELYKIQIFMKKCSRKPFLQHIRGIVWIFDL